MRKSVTFGTAIGVIAALGLAAPAAAGSRDDDDDHNSYDDAVVYVLHAVPDTTVDVYVDGELTLDDFEPGDLTEALAVDAGVYSVAVTASDADDDSDPIIGPTDVTVEDGGNYTSVAHLTEDGDPTITTFSNAVDDYGDDQGRLTVRHVAAAPAVDVLADGETVVEDLSNPDEASLDLDPGTVSAAVALAGTTDPVIGPADVDVTESATTVVYAWGSADDDNLALFVQTIDTDNDDNGDGHHDGDDHHYGDHDGDDHDNGDHHDRGGDRY